jgi:CRISPR-associated DxTHG motif protein
MKLLQSRLVTWILIGAICFVGSVPVWIPSSYSVADEFQPQVVANAYIVVAAADSSEAAQAIADYVCDGVDDQVTINTAIAAVLPASSSLQYFTDDASVLRSVANQGGTVHLAAGNYHLSAAVSNTTHHNLVIEGEGPATNLIQEAVDGSHAISMVGTGLTYGLINVQVRDLQITGNVASGDGVYMAACSHNTCHNVYVSQCGTSGIHFYAPSSLGMGNKCISDCRSVRNFGYGIWLQEVHETLISNCHIEENTLYGIYSQSAVDVHITGCSVEDNYDYAFYSDTNNGLCITGTIFEGTARIGTGSALISGSVIGDSITFGGTSCTISSSFVKLGTGSAISLNVASSDVTLAGNLSCQGIMNLSGKITVGSSSGIYATTNNAKIDIGPGTLTCSYPLLIDCQAWGYTGSTVRLHDLTIPSASLTVKDVANATVCNCTFVGAGGTVSYNNCDYMVLMQGNVINTSTAFSTTASSAGIFRVTDNIITGSNFTNSGTGASKFFNNTVTDASTGWNVSRTSGTATVPNGATYYDVTHGLNFTPTAAQITVTPTGWGNAASFYISDIGASTFRINVNADPGASTATFSWHAGVLN